MNFKKHIDGDKNLKIIKNHASKLGIESFLVGGYIRDLLLNRLCKDIDIMTIGEPYNLINLVSKEKGFSKVKIFKTFGTASISYQKFNYEFVGARKESYSKSSRNPDVSPGLFEDDMKRRDFTINAFAVSINKKHGEFIDTFNGVEDLKNKVIRTCDDPHKPFEDDPLNFDIEKNTFKSIIDNSERIKIVSQERITDELNKIILTENPSYGFKLLFASGLLKHFFKEMYNLHGVEKINNHSHKDNFYHTLEVLDNTAKVSDSLWLRWSAILHDIAKPHTKRYKENTGWTFHGHEDLGSRLVPKIFQRLKLPQNDKMKYVQNLVKLHLRPIALIKDHITDSAIRRLVFDAGDDIDDLMKLCRADITTKNPDKAKRYLNNFDIVEKKIDIVEKNDKIKNFQPPISGEEIIDIFAIKPSKIIGELKNEIKNQILDGKIKNNKEEALKLLYKLGASKGLERIK